MLNDPSTRDLYTGGMDKQFDAPVEPVA
jgi:hypothetical protein